MLEKEHNSRQMKDPPRSNSHKAAQVYIHHRSHIVKVVLGKRALAAIAKPACLTDVNEERRGDQFSYNLQC